MEDAPATSSAKSGAECRRPSKMANREGSATASSSQHHRASSSPLTESEEDDEVWSSVSFPGLDNCLGLLFHLSTLHLIFPASHQSGQDLDIEATAASPQFLVRVDTQNLHQRCQCLINL